MRKGITKEQVINKALELMKDRETKSVNLRVVARELGCAHTNLYNYFNSFDELLSEAYIRVLQMFSEMLKKRISVVDDYQLKLKVFFSEIISFYMDNKGWFRLLWVEVIGGKHKVVDYIAASKTVDEHVAIMENILKHLFTIAPTPEQIKSILHIVHCYIYGEISLYVANHSFIQEDTEIFKREKLIPIFEKSPLISTEEAFKKYVSNEALNLFYLYLGRKE